MSYDLMVFDPAAALRDRPGFSRWYAEQVTWKEDHSYDDPIVNAACLQAWYADMRSEYPALNGPFASEPFVDNSKNTDYGMGEHVIYAAFRWDAADSARDAVFSRARKHGVGFFDVSEDDGGVWIPDSSGRYRWMHGGGGRLAALWKWLTGR